MRRATFAALLAASLLGSEAVARADDNAASIEAEGLFKDARGFLDKGETGKACELFLRSQKRQAAIGTLLNLGACYEKLGKIATAWATYREAVNLATMRKDIDRAEIATKEAARLEPHLPRLTIEVQARETVETLTRNGEPVDRSVWGRPTPVDPGAQKVRASGPGFEPWEGSATVASGGQETIRVPALKPASGSWVPLAVTIGGGAVLAGGLVFGGLTMSAWSDADARCPGGKCPDEATRRAAADDASSAQTYATVSTIGVITGLAAIAAGVVLHFVLKPTSD